MKTHRLCLPLITVLLFGCTSAPEKPAAEASLPPCGGLPNCVNSQIGEGSSAIEPLHATAEQWESLKRWLSGQKNWTITIASDDFVQAVVKTPLLRFRDDVQLLFDEQAGVIQMRSSSRLGISDMGTNRQRLETLRTHLADEDAESCLADAGDRHHLVTKYHSSPQYHHATIVAPLHYQWGKTCDTRYAIAGSA
ncbi:DUF1499 domain-containing protein [Halieaceae bacterium IMCC14734]|uniref:DUF1499 domain-containing protein n=1 Tax=Candidatus Litorirhabdus singularis TaxID=2518993 RepID=A0ABT3TGZ9_9GAMM|nr:DUF1499 domain-containing protein [Candidatus Litorirhabdus singularis]